MATDAHGNPIDFEITGGNVHDAKIADTLIKKIGKALHFIADKGYDSEAIRETALKNHSIDFFIGAADLPVRKIKRTVNQFCMETNIPFSFAGVGVNNGSWGPMVIPQKTLCINCFNEKENQPANNIELEVANKVSAPTKASFGPTNTIISTLLAKDIILYLTGQTDIPSINTRFSFDFKTNQISQFQTDIKNCNC